MTDEQLVKQCLENNRNAQQELFEKYSRKMMSLCIRYAGNEDDAKDILQEGFIKVFIHLKDYSGNGNLSGWIKSIMVNTALNFLKKSVYLTEMVQMEEGYAVSGIAQSESRLGEQELMKLIRSLPDGFRTIFNLFAIEGYTHKEIAHMMGISENTSKTQYLRARARLQKMINAKSEKVIA
ncbi:MAG: RNA polymerase sigma factor [Bacteroidia bacterium]|nr:RNA polymerase sigma factor [Bacteroidia bacterium]